MGGPAISIYTHFHPILAAWQEISIYIRFYPFGCPTGRPANKIPASTKIFVDTTNTFVVWSLSMKQAPQKPTASELEILRVLWTRGPSTVREVHDALQEKKPMGYTSVLKFMQIMTAKGTVRRNETQRAHVYEACLPAEQTKRQIAGDMLQRVFEGSASQLMMHALAGRSASREEVDELRRLLNQYESDEHERTRR
jgi:predicted transcriptional regulator